MMHNRNSPFQTNFHRLFFLNRPATLFLDSSSLWPVKKEKGIGKLGKGVPDDHLMWIARILCANIQITLIMMPEYSREAMEKIPSDNGFSVGVLMLTLYGLSGLVDRMDFLGSFHSFGTQE